MALIMTLLFANPLRELVLIRLLDKLKQGRGPLVAKSVSATVLVVFISILRSAIEIKNRSIEAGGVINPTDAVLMEDHFLEASLMGFCLFMALMIDRLHYYIKELSLSRKVLKEVQMLDFEGRKNEGEEEK
ncbi:hypothetical protein HS088_TW21G00089 [Tripterygium wilfordii]|uniref:Endoplasmic reticulum transmembrane protein n=2 Tax=Tripterygium wilfordii TaxID=458696 RepID=A0A7J7C1B2_TRIWF|nr:hypothetical protein HS088_TW21G00089 [Tripterygium wilfordii]